MTTLTRTGSCSWSIEGELTFATVAGILDQAPQVKLAATGVLDLAGVTRAASAGLALLVEWLGMARDRGSTLEFTGLSTEMLRLVQVADLDSLICNNHSR